jgi:hypothetical protein
MADLQEGNTLEPYSLTVAQQFSKHLMMIIISVETRLYQWREK